MRNIRDIYSMKTCDVKLVRDFDGYNNSAITFNLYDKCININVVEWLNEDGSLVYDTHVQDNVNDYARRLEYVGDISDLYDALRKKIVDAHEYAIRKAYDTYLDPTDHYMDINSGTVQTGEKWIRDAVDEPTLWDIFEPVKVCDQLVSVVWDSNTQAWIES